ncbi:MAG: hypothetical protein F4187_05540 [Gemmatimonadetes bacterium]|nr:hypothetical protein [Gemmatimonadota bacterium]MYI06711.1 hypothetical protein [Gemmatimonadota bacterium]
MPDASKMIRVSAKSLDGAREAFDALMTNGKQDYRIVRGRPHLDERVFAVNGRQGIAFLLTCYVASGYDAGGGELPEPRVTDRQLIEAALRALSDILTDATHRISLG